MQDELNEKVLAMLSEDSAEESGNPLCISKALCSLINELKNAQLSSETVRVTALRRLVIASGGTAGSLDKKKFAKKLKKLTAAKLLPKVVRAIADLVDEPNKSNLVDAADRCQSERTSTAAIAAALADGVDGTVGIAVPKTDDCGG